MTPSMRLARFRTTEDVNDAHAADPHITADLADGMALRELQEALPEGVYADIASPTVGDDWDTDWMLTLTSGSEDGRETLVRFDGSLDYTGSTIAEAADACRAALPVKP